MKTNKAIELCDFLMQAVGFFEEVYERKVSGVSDLEGKKKRFTKNTFESRYNAFHEELISNMREYRDIDIIYDYVGNAFERYDDWGGFDEDLNREIMQGGYEVKFLLKLKLTISQYGDLIDSLTWNGSSSKKDYVEECFEREMAKLEEDTDDEEAELKPQRDDRFDFDKMNKECREMVPDALERMHFIHDRLYDFRQWQLKYDKPISADRSSGKKKNEYKYSFEYYPNFEKLCTLELERLETKLDLQKKALTHKAIENNPIIIQGNDSSPYIWNPSDTDLLELVAALHKNDTFKRKDGRPLTRKELVAYFQQIFNLEIKDVEGKLNRATGRKRNMTPFIDSLKCAFESYAEEKEGKLQGRK